MNSLPGLNSTLPVYLRVAIATAFFVASQSSIQAQTKASPKGKAQAPVDKAAQANLKFKEAEALREIYIVLAGANHDYDGHRAKAMGQIQSAVKLLDKAVAKNGSVNAKTASAYEDAVAGAAKLAAKGAATVHELQSVSDARLKKALLGLAEVRPTPVQLKQKNVLNHVDTAIKELNIALKIR
jgi:hypothetical protein